MSALPWGHLARRCASPSDHLGRHPVHTSGWHDRVIDGP